MTHVSSSRFASRPWFFLGLVWLGQFAAFWGMNLLGFAVAEYVGARIKDAPLGIAFEVVVRALGFPLFELAQLRISSLVLAVLVAAVNAAIWAVAALLILRACRQSRA